MHTDGGAYDYGWSNRLDTAQQLDVGEHSPTSPQRARPSAARRPVPLSASSARVSSAHHARELAELGVVDEGDDGEEDVSQLHS